MSLQRVNVNSKASTPRCGSQNEYSASFSKTSFQKNTVPLEYAFMEQCTTQCLVFTPPKEQPFTHEMLLCSITQP